MMKHYRVNVGLSIKSLASKLMRLVSEADGSGSKRDMATADLPPIPIPDRLLDLLREYPDAIEQIRDRLDRYLEEPDALQPLDHALWALKDRLSSLISKAQDELNRAEASGNNADAITKAKAKLSAMFRAASSNGGLRDTGVIVDYFKEHEEAF